MNQSESEMTAAHISPSKGGVMRTYVTLPINSGRPKIRCPDFNDELRKYIEGVPEVYIPNYSLLWTCTNPGWGNDTNKLLKYFNKRCNGGPHAFTELPKSGLVVIYADMLVESRLWRTSIPINRYTWDALLSTHILNNISTEFTKMKDRCVKDPDLFPDPVRIHVISPRLAELCGPAFQKMPFDEINKVADDHCEPILYIELKRRERTMNQPIDNNSFQAIIGYSVTDYSNNKTKKNPTIITVNVLLPCQSFLEYLTGPSVTSFVTNINCHQPPGNEDVVSDLSLKRKLEIDETAETTVPAHNDNLQIISHEKKKLSTRKKR